MIQSTDTLKDEWNKNAGYYSNKLENGNIVQAIQLYNMLNVPDDSTIIEVGCGSGIFSSYLLNNLNIKCKYISLDLSDKMLEIAEARKKTLKYSPSIDHKFVQGNAEDLSLFNDESINVYISPLCIHLVDDPVKALKEAFRIMKKGASFGFSVLGTPEKCTQITLYKKNLEKIGFEGQAKWSPFHLADHAKLINLIQDAGLTVEYCWNTTVASSSSDLEPFMIMLDTFWNFSKTYTKLTQEQKSQLKTSLGEDLERMRKEKIPIQIEFALVVGKKQQVQNQIN